MPYSLDVDWPIHALAVRPTYAEALRCLEAEVIE